MSKVHPVCQAMLDMIAETPPPESGTDLIALTRNTLEARASQSQNENSHQA